MRPRQPAKMRPPAASPFSLPDLFLRGNFAMQSICSHKLQNSLHVGVIMDGNGRWATRLGLPRAMGHEAGVKAVRRIVEAAPDHGIGTLTLYAFSSDNWRRPEAEVEALMALLAHYLIDETENLVRQGGWCGHPRRHPQPHRRHLA